MLLDKDTKQITLGRIFELGSSDFFQTRPALSEIQVEEWNWRDTSLDGTITITSYFNPIVDNLDIINVSSSYESFGRGVLISLAFYGDTLSDEAVSQALRVSGEIRESGFLLDRSLSLSEESWMVLSCWKEGQEEEQSSLLSNGVLSWREG
jgi:hypothetical protein